MTMTNQQVTDLGQARQGKVQDAIKAGDFIRAFELAHTLAMAGDASAQGLIGCLYAEGLGVKQDRVWAWAWIDQALKRGCVLDIQEEFDALTEELKETPDGAAYADAWLLSMRLGNDVSKTVLESFGEEAFMRDYVRQVLNHPQGA